MNNTYFTVGPSQLYPTVHRHVSDALEKDVLSLSHRSAFFTTLYADTVSHLKRLFGLPSDYEVFFTSSATEAWERILQNCVEHNSIHVVNGAFAKKFYTMAQDLGKNPVDATYEDGKVIDLNKLNVPDDSEMICLVQNETSTGLSLPAQSIYSLKKKYPDQLLTLDVVSSAPYFDMDYSFADCILFSVQKGFGLPAGLGVMMLSPVAMERAAELRKKGMSDGSYHNFQTLKKYGDKHQTPETPNVLGIYLLNKVVHDMLEKGIETIRKETEEKAALLYDFFVQSEKYHLFVSDPSQQSKTTIVVEVEGGSAHILSNLSDKGIIIGRGYGGYKDRHIRIANFPAHSMEDIKRLLKHL